MPLELRDFARTLPIIATGGYPLNHKYEKNGPKGEQFSPIQNAQLKIILIKHDQIFQTGHK